MRRTVAPLHAPYRIFIGEYPGDIVGAYSRTLPGYARIVRARRTLRIYSRAVRGVRSLL